MKNKNSLKFLAVLIFFTSVVICFADNPIIQTNYTADPAPMVYDGKCYVYTTHDEDVTINDFFTMNDWKCYSSTDMVNWTDHGTILSYTSVSWGQGEAWAAQCVYRNNKFYFYFTLVKKGGSRSIGVAVADSPTGPFSDPLGAPLIDLFGWDDIDPTVFIDDDGQAYLYWGNPNLYYVRLNQNMVSYSGNAVQVSPKPSNYQEGPWFYKRNGIYYMIYPTTCCGEGIAYATSSGPTGPWTSRNVIMPAQGASFTNHPGICDFAGNSYFFYHNGALPGGGGYKRSVCIEQFSYNTDGTIPAMNMTSTGPAQVGSLNPYDTTQAETICWESGIETETCSEGGMNVANIENGDWIKIKGVDFGNGATSFDARVASNTSGGNIEIRLNSQTGTLVGTCAVSGTNGWQNWETVTCDVSGATGKHDLYLKFTGGSGFLFNINWWKFYGGTESTPEPTVDPTPEPTPTQAVDGNIIISARGTLGGETLELRIDGNLTDSWTMSTEYQDYYAIGTGTIELHFINDDELENGMDIQVDYITYNNATYQAEDQEINTAVYVDGVCGGSYSEWLHCNGYIRFTTGSTGTTGDVNSDGTIDIVDALLIAQAYVDLNPVNYNPAYADTNCDGTVDIVDALLTAQYYVGLIDGFCL